MKKQRSAEPAPAPPEKSAEEGEDLLQILLDEFADAEPPRPLPARIDGVVVGWLSGVNTASGPLVTVTRGAQPVPARALATIAAEDDGREVALMFEGGDPGKPLIMGFVQRLAPVPGAAATEIEKAPAAPEEEPTAIEKPIDVQSDGERIVLSAGKEIVLQCGKASITLTRAGKILIRGAYVLTRSSGVNRILGGSVQIN